MISIYGLRQCEAGGEVSVFLTNKNRFVNRDEGAEIARNAHQVPSHITYLFSEDLY